MSRNYTRLYCHFIWSTKRREPVLTPEIECLVHDFIRHKCSELKVHVHAIDGAADHVHLVCSLPTSLCISDFMETTKGSSSHFINDRPSYTGSLYWQEGYGALTVSKRDLPHVVAYVNQQKQHHKTGKLLASLERLTDG